MYTPGETAHVRVHVGPEAGRSHGEIALCLLVSGESRVFYKGTFEPKTYGPYEVAITNDYEVYQVQVQAGDVTAIKSFYGIRPWRGMKDFSEAVSPYGICLSYENTTPWDRAVKGGAVPLDRIDAKWALASHPGTNDVAHEDWWLWTHYATGTVGLEGGRTGLFWGEYNPWNNVRLEGAEAAALRTEAMLPNEIYFRERIQPMLRMWADNLSEESPGVPLRIWLGDHWGIGRGIGRGYGTEILRFSVSWMKEQFGITVEADTFKELIQKCREYPEHFEYFIARNTTFRSLELTCEAVRDVVAGSTSWDRSGESNRELVTLPEAAEFCEILSRCLGVGTSDDRAAFQATNGNPLPYSLSNMVIKALAPEHSLSVGWTGCGSKSTEGEIYRWYLEPAWLTAYDAAGKLRHVYTHSPPRGPDGVWRSLIEGEHAADEKIRIHDKCFQLMEAIGVEKPVGPVFVCKDWTFADDKAGKAYRSDLYEGFLISLRRHKVPVSCAVHVDHESNVPDDLPRVYAARMNGSDEIQFGFKAGSVEKWFTCKPPEIPAPLIADFAAQLNSASGNPIIFPAGTSIEGYAFGTKGMIFVVAQEMAGGRAQGEIKVKVGAGRWTVMDLIPGGGVLSKRQGEYVVFEASLEAHSARLYCVRCEPM